MSIKHAYLKYKQFGGVRLLSAYMRLGVITAIVKDFFHCSRYSINDIYSSIERKVNPILYDRYQTLLEKYDFSTEPSGSPSNKIWFSWWQGMDSAPEMVRICLSQLKKTMPEREIIVVTEHNYQQYVTFPPHIIEKVRNNCIPMAMLTDLLRLELLIRYGGMWIDATVLCTGWEKGSPLEQIINKQIQAPLFMYRYEDRKGRFHGFSNWFISSAPQHEVLKATLEVLYAYWRDYDCVLNYYIFHRFIGLIVAKQPDLLERIPKGSSRVAIWLGNQLKADYDEELWHKLVNRQSFHKMNYRKAHEAQTNAKSYYNEIIRRYSNNQL